MDSHNDEMGFLALLTTFCLFFKIEIDKKKNHCENDQTPQSSELFFFYFLTLSLLYTVGYEARGLKDFDIWILTWNSTLKDIVEDCKD